MMAGETVLIVEDHRENIVHLANNVLKPNGYKVITAMDGRQGLRRILADEPDLVILDLNMPKMDGLEVLAALRERQVDIPVILTTFYGSEQVAEQALRLGATDYVVKPYKVTDMLHTVETALAHRRPRPAPSRPSEPEEPDQTMPAIRQAERWMRDMNILTRIGKALVAQLDMNKVCVRTVEAALYISRANHAFLLLLNEGRRAKLCLCATRGPDDREVRLIKDPVASELAQQVARSGQTLVLANAKGEATLAGIVGHPLGPLAAAPLRWEKETFGVLIATRAPGETAFSEADAAWLASLADYAAIAVRNARLHQQPCEAVALPGLDEQGIPYLRRELEQLAAELRTITEQVQELAERLAGEEAH
jgi:two-component system NtrC family sensor kinase